MTRIKQPKPPPHPGDLFAATLAVPSEAPPSYSTTPPETAPATTSPSTSGSVDCTFCGKTQREVKNLVAGPRVGRLLIAICDECITLAASIVTEGAAPPEAAPDSTTTATTHEADALPQPDLRPLFPLLFATPSPRVTPIAEQCAARGEEVPVGQTAGVLRVLGYEVPIDVDDMARLVVSNDPKASIASTGRLTGYAWKRDAHAALMWFHDHPEVLPAISHESLAEHYTYLRRVLRTEWRAERAESEAMMIVTANVMLRIYTEAGRRETALEVAARSESLASPVVTPLDPAVERIFEALWAVRGRARLGLRIEPGDALTVTVAFERADVPEAIARLAARDADLSVAVRIERADLEAHEGLDVVMGRGGRHVREAVARVARYLASRAAPSASTH